LVGGLGFGFNTNWLAFIFFACKKNKLSFYNPASLLVLTPIGVKTKPYGVMLLLLFFLLAKKISWP
jgi:hypothetical protein